MKIMLLSILLLISLTSCTAEQTPELLSDDIELPPQTTEVTEATETSAVMSEITEAPAEPTPVEIPDGEYVYLYLKEDVGWECTAEIPHINISPELDAMVNADIDRLFTSRIPNAQNGAFGAYRVQFEYSVTDGLFSLLVWSGEGTSPGSPSYPYTVTVDLETKQILTVHTVLAKYGYDYISVMDEIDTQSTFWSAGNVDTNNPDYDYFDIQMYDFSGGMFYIDTEGHINLVGKSYSTHLGENRSYETYRYSVSYDLHDKTMLALM